MGHLEFGNLGVKIRGIVYYKISQHEQKAFAGWITKGIPNSIRRVRGQFWRVTPFFVGTYVLYDQAQKYHQKLQRKNPDDYANDE